MHLNREQTAFSLLGIFLIWPAFGAHGIEINAPCGNDCGLSLKSDPQTVLMGISIMAFLIARKTYLPSRLGDRIVRIWRRLVAFHVDCFVSIIVIISIDAGIIIALNAVQTGTIVWEIEFAASAASVLLTIFLIIFSIWAMFSYFTWHKKRQIPTIGQQICGFMIVRDDNRPTRDYWYGTLIAYVAMCSVHLWIWFERFREPQAGTYWWDRAAGTRPKTFF